MPRPAKAIKPREKTLSLPGDLVDKVDILLFSALEMKVPHGAWAGYVTRLIEEDLSKKRAKDASQS